MTGTCPACGEATDPVADVAPSLIAAALAQSVNVEVVGVESPVDDVAAVKRH